MRFNRYRRHRLQDTVIQRLSSIAMLFALGANRMSPIASIKVFSSKVECLHKELGGAAVMGFTTGLFTLRVFARNLLRGFLMTKLGYEPRLLSLISRMFVVYILDHGDFNHKNFKKTQFRTRRRTRRRKHGYSYIHNWPLQPFSQNVGLASHTTR